MRTLLPTSYAICVSVMQIVTMVTVAGTLLLVPLVLAALELPKEWGVSPWVPTDSHCNPCIKEDSSY